MDIKSLKDIVLLNKKDDVLRFHLYLKLLQFNIKPIENHIDIILELYKQGGYSNSEEQNVFIKKCIDKKLRKSNQSLRNLLSEYVIKGVFKKSKNCSLSLKEEFIPKIDCKKLVLNYMISHAE